MSIIYPDPEHQRAKGNLKYFEFQLEKQKKAEQDAPPKETKQEEEEATDKEEKKKPRKKRETFQLIPERKKYEMLCRGEGIKMVRKSRPRRIWSLLTLSACVRACVCEFHLVIWTPGSPLFSQTPRRASRLFCRYFDSNRNPKYVLSPVKQQDEWDRPYIVRYLDIITDDEIEMVKKLAKPRVSAAQARFCRESEARVGWLIR